MISVQAGTRAEQVLCTPIENAVEQRIETTESETLN